MEAERKIESKDNNTQEISLDAKIHQYAESFTIHGLPRILTGTKTERIIWTIFVMLSMSLGGYMTYKYITRYLRYEVSHHFSKGVTDKAFYPSATFCLPEIKERMEWSYFSDCFIPKRFVLDTISNGIFNIDFCNLGGSNNCRKSSIRWRDDLKGICFTVFPVKKYYQLTGTALLNFYVAEDLLEIQQVSVTIHDQNTEPFFLRPQLQIQPNQRYIINLKKTVSKRLPHPFPSNCTNKTNNHNFPGNYNRRTCLFVNRYIESYKESNVLTSIGELYIPEKIIEEYGNMKKFLEIDNVFTEIEWNDKVCALSCYEVEYEVNYSLKGLTFSPELSDERIDVEDITENVCPEFGENFTNFSYFHIELAYENPEYLMEEKQAYTIENLLAEIGGFLGLMIGASLLSVVEIFGYCSMLLMNKITKIQKPRT